MQVDQVKNQKSNQNQLNFHDLPVQLVQRVKQLITNKFKVSDLGRLAKYCQSQLLIEQLQGAIGIRKLLSQSQNQPIQEVIDAGLVPTLIFFLKSSKSEFLRVEAGWALSNITAGSTKQCMQIKQNGGIALFIELLNQKNISIVQHSIWAIGNFSGDCFQFRDFVIRSNGLSPLCDIIQKSQNCKLIKSAAWAISNLCRGSPVPNLSEVKESIGPICKVLKMQLGDKDLTIDLCWALSYLTQSKTNLQLAMDTGVITSLVKLLDSDQIKVIVPVIRSLGNFSAGNQTQVQQLLKSNVLSKFYNLLDFPQSIVKREVCWSLSNIAATSKKIAKFLLNTTELMEKVVNLLSIQNQNVKKEILWIFKNFCIFGDEDMANFLIQHDFMSILVTQLRKDSSVNLLVLQTIFHAFQLDEKLRDMKQKNRMRLLDRFKEVCGCQKIQEMQQNPLDQVSTKTRAILDRFFKNQSQI